MTDDGLNGDRLDSAALELSSQQAALAFERNQLSLDQSLLGAVRTSLAMIGFGFATVLFFHQVSGQTGVDLRVPARNFGLSLVVMGMGLVAVTMLDHRRRFARLRARMNELHDRGLLRERFVQKRSYVALFAQLLLLVGLLVIAGIVIRIGPFQDSLNPSTSAQRAAPTTLSVPPS